MMVTRWRIAGCMVILALSPLERAVAQTPPPDSERPYRVTMTVEGLDSRDDGVIVQNGRGQAVSAIGLLVTSDDVLAISPTTINVGGHVFSMGADTLFCLRRGKATKVRSFAVGEPITVTSPDGKSALSVKKGLALVPTVTMGEDGVGRRETVVDYLCPADHTRKFPVSDADARREYETQKADATEYHTRSMLLATEAEANDVIDKLREGESFETLAKLSKQASTRDKGGDDGFRKPTDLLNSAFVETMRRLKPGTFTDKPVKSYTGWLVIRVEEVRSNFPPFERMKSAIKQQIAQQRYEADMQRQLTGK